MKGVVRFGVSNSNPYEDFPIQIIDRQVNWLSNKEVVSVKMLWKNHIVEATTWETEADMKSRYPHLFDEYV